MRTHARVWLVIASLLAISGASVAAPSVDEPRPGVCEISGVATVYHDSLHGQKTASGEQYDRQALTAAHRTLPIGTRVLVTNLQNARQVVVRINDRGPFAPGKMIDLSTAAASRLGMDRPGRINVRLALDTGESSSKAARPERAADRLAHFNRDLRAQRAAGQGARPDAASERDAAEPIARAGASGSLESDTEAGRLQ